MVVPDDYEVGRGRPPRHSRFKPGQSGNPRGRERGSKNLSSLLEAALDATVEVTEGGRRKKKTYRALIPKLLVNRAASGDLKAIAMVLEQMVRLEAVASPTGRTHTRNDEAVLRGLRERFTGPTGGDDVPEP